MEIHMAHLATSIPYLHEMVFVTYNDGIILETNNNEFIYRKRKTTREELKKVLLMASIELLDSMFNAD